MKDLIDKYVDKTVRIWDGGFYIDVIIKDVKISWGKERYLVTPISGKGEAWVESIQLELELD